MEVKILYLEDFQRSFVLGEEKIFFINVCMYKQFMVVIFIKENNMVYMEQLYLVSDVFFLYDFYMFILV